MSPRRSTAAILIVYGSLVLGSLVFGQAALAAPPRPADLPTERAQIGDAFVEAWIAFRRDLDTLAHGGAHPALLERWLAAAPPFLLRDAIGIGSEPQVILAAAEALAERRDPRDHPRLAALAAAHRDQPNHHLFWGARIRARDRTAREQALSGLDDPRPAIRLAAASALAAAGHRRGLDSLREQLREGPRVADGAARALGRFGAAADANRIERAAARYGTSPALAAARGEIALRETFPDHHRALLRRDPAGHRANVSSGLYDTWLTALGRAIRDGATGSSAVLDRIGRIRREHGGGGEGEVVRRRLEKLVDWWNAVNQTLRATTAEPSWPRSYGDAIASVRSWAPGRKPEPKVLTDRVAAAISLCVWGARALDHEALWGPESLPAPLSPGADRLVDGNLATSWHAAAGDQLAFELAAGSTPRRLWIANTCPDGAGPPVAELRVAGTGPEGDWESSTDLDGGTRYFQAVELPARPTHRLTVTFAEIDGGRPACLAEIRIH